ncbi:MULTISPECIES: hypothetical protein [Pseudonocardia]|uniref:Uncharacterized protein n=3 Tax=Pseudonocardia TaxID=1847 RepID=A0A1Y2MIK8_PSEAH|nr:MULTISPECIES: hypothetical protein [Pseudonocardia]MBP2371228.1 hypothetical protein [Pseudonocardia parietis]OSY34527.1 hypothetical protein BG845_06765 [Pseudonocardia autotrophica]TDN65528.1 hypothetical protein C8E95_7020 [Pseudonocardia autotrophica]BBG05653.1 hypothetical protein Pdca_68620 [Pseudonocardia autotrophica]GEC29574.1 hypothetical protein PSA01_66030 [Pseudonocardia saturnea]
MTTSLNGHLGSASARPLAPRARTVGNRAPLLLSLFGLLVGTLVVADVQSPVRAAFVFLFVLVVPGRAVLDCWGLAGGWLGAALVVATSVSIATVLATAQLYLGLWSPSGTVLALVLVTVVAQIARYWSSQRDEAVPS